MSEVFKLNKEGTDHKKFIMFARHERSYCYIEEFYVRNKMTGQHSDRIIQFYSDEK